jgi:hypothetical protein
MRWRLKRFHADTKSIIFEELPYESGQKHNSLLKVAHQFSICLVTGGASVSAIREITPVRGRRSKHANQQGFSP